MTDYRDRIQELEEGVAGELDLEEVGVSHRYGSLYDYLRKKKQMNNKLVTECFCPNSFRAVLVRIRLFQLTRKWGILVIVEDRRL